MDEPKQLELFPELKQDPELKPVIIKTPSSNTYRRYIVMNRKWVEIEGLCCTYPKGTF